MNKTKTIAVCGKGGVGKTSISAMISIILSENADMRILAIDADPAIGLSTALGIQVRRTVDDIRHDLIGSLEKNPAADKTDILHSLDYDLFQSIEEKGNLSFLAIGRPEQEGCYCQVNDLLREIISETASAFDFVIIDAEAGIEQINRRVMETVTHLVLVSDLSVKGRNVIKTIGSVAAENSTGPKSMIVYNMVRPEDEIGVFVSNADYPVMAVIPDDYMVREFDKDGRSFWGITASSAYKILKEGIKSHLS
jgi:CO dehydrogenase maturation factor